ncbi:MAG: GGDEF domain-containing protein [Evtepia sp.]
MHRTLKMILVCLLLFCVPAAASFEESTTIRIGFPQQPRLTESSADGQLSGYTYDYLMEISQYTGWNYEFVIPDGKDLNENLAILMDMLKNHEIDLLGGMKKNEALESQFSYAAYHYGVSSVVLLAPLSNAALTSYNYYKQEPLRIAVLAHAKQQNALLQKFCDTTKLSPILVPCETEAEQLQVLHTQKADLMLSRDLAIPPNTKILAKFSPEPFFFVGTLGDTALMNQLNYALLTIEESNPGFPATRYHHYFSSPAMTALVLSDEEKTYIQQSDVFQVGVVPDRNPLCFMDNNVVSGILSDVLHEIIGQSGLKFEFKTADTLSEFQKLAPQCDLIMGMDYDYQLAKDYNMIITQPTLTMPYVRVIDTAAHSNNRDVGFPQRMKNVAPHLITKGYNAVFFETASQVLDALVKDDIGAAYLEPYVAQTLISGTSYRTLYLSPVPGESSTACFGITKEKPMLVSIFSKALHTVSPAQVQTFVYQNTLRPQHMTFQRLISLYPVQSVLLTSFILLFIIFMLVLYLKRTKRLKRTMEENNRRYLQLCDLVGEVICEYNYKTDVLSVLGSGTAWLNGSVIYKQFCASRPNNSEMENRIDYALSSLISTNSTGELTRLFALEQNKQRWLCINHQVVPDALGTPSYFICKVTDVDDRMKDLQDLAQKAQTDPLTGLYNMEAFRGRVTNYISSHLEGGVFLILDIDHFKNINDSQGHLEGDRVLKQLADILCSVFQDYVVGRLGGDEFVVFAGGLCEISHISEKCEAVMLRCADISSEFPVTVSIGAVRFSGALSVDKLYKKADDTLYRVKRKSRNSFEIL